MTYSELVSRLKKSGIDESHSDAYILLEEYCGIGIPDLISYPDRDYSSPELESAVAKRCSRVPLQYIIGHWYFYGLDFRLNEDTLCPRPDTEISVETAIELFPKNIVFADIGTGSGCIALSVLKNRPDLKALCIDISEKALEAAKENASLLGVADRASFLKADALGDSFADLLQGVGAIISNPPYIPSGEIAGLQPEVQMEPVRALDGGADGLAFYRKITSGGAKQGINYIIYEVGAGQAEAVAKQGLQYGYSHRFCKDIAGIDRTVILEKKDMPE